MDPRAANRARTLRGALLRLGLVVAALLFVIAADILVAAVLHRFGIAGPRDSFRVADPLTHHGLAPMVDAAEAVWGDRRYSLSTNSLGLRDRGPRRIDPSAQHRRVLLLGDSFTEGIGVEWEASFAGLLAQRLGPGVEVLDAGVVSYAPILYLAKARWLLEEQGLAVETVVVLLDPSDIEDEAVRYRRGSDGRVRGNEGVDEALKRFIDRRTVLIRAAREALRRRRFEGGQRQFRQRKALWTVEPELMREFGRDGLARAERHMHELAELVARHGARLVVMVYPWPDHLARGDRDSLQVRTWRAWAAREGVHFVDGFELFFSQGEPHDVIARFFIPGDVHWNERGHALVAERLARELRSEG